MGAGVSEAMRPCKLSALLRAYQKPVPSPTAAFPSSRLLGLEIQNPATGLYRLEEV